MSDCWGKLFIFKTDSIGETHLFTDTINYLTNSNVSYILKGIKYVYFDIGMYSTKGGYLIGKAIVEIDFQL